MSPPNPFILASSASPHLLPLLRSHPHLATTQDPTGYSLLHALTSYSHPALLLTLSREFHLDPNALLDSDGETALFAAESVAVARVLVEDMGCDIGVRNREGETAEEKIRAEGEWENEEEEVADPAFRARIEELAARDDFRDEEGQRRLKELVTEAVRGVERDVGAEGRDVRRRV
ncbi:MAG: hypothetical protein LQ345_006172 [Seirophora villosa]|nr:MAG: hypothetical protein LQ345_006172 [Seirophora villosa]